MKDRAITYLAPHTAPAELPRAIGAALVCAKRRGSESVLSDLRTSGALKLLFPQSHGLEVVALNTSGGLTGGDRLSLTATATAGSQMTLTTQAAERAYRSASGFAQASTHLTAGPKSRINWLPQETILFDGCALRRNLYADLAQDAELLLVEPLVFGRQAMGERLTDAALEDCIEIRRTGSPLYKDRVRFSGDISASLKRAAIGNGAGAMASLVFVSPSAEAQLHPIRALLPDTGGASLRAPDVLVLRLLAEDSFALRQSLLPVLDRLTTNTLPKCWRL